MKKKLLILLLCVSLTLGIMVSSSPMLALAENEADDQATETVIEDTAQITKWVDLFGTGDMVEFERKAALGDFELYFADVNKEINRTLTKPDDKKVTNEEQKVKLAAHVFAVKNVKTGNVWYSIPSDIARINGSERLNEAASTLLLSYCDKNGIETSNCTVTSVKDKSYTVKSVTNGIQVDYTINESAKGVKVTVPFVLTLNKDGFNVSVDMAQIKFEGENDARLLSVSIMPSFGCGRLGTDGYMLVPDGSGALIDNNYSHPNGTVLNYYTYVYDRDPSLSVSTKFDVNEPTIMPVFGTKLNDQQAWLAVIDDGDALATIRANYARTSNPFTTQYAEFAYRSKDIFMTSDRWEQRPYKQYSELSYKENVSINYYLLDGEDADYVGMAKKYREYLMSKGADGDSVKSDVEMFIETYGAITKKVSKFGFVVEELQSVTTFEQAAQMVEAFKKAGINNINLRYTGWMDGGMDGKPVVNADPAGIIGSKNDLKELNKVVNAAGGNLYMNVEVVETSKDRFGWSLNKYASRNMINEIIQNAVFGLVTGEASDTNFSYLTAPSFYQEQIDAFIKDYKQYSINAVSAGSLGRLVYSDFNTNDKKFKNRQQTLDYAKKAIETLDRSTGSLMIEQGNGYSLPYADVILDAPMYSSGLEITSTDVPFMQIALHGLVTYTESAHNQTSSDKQTQLLRQLETGAAPYYMLSYEDSSIYLDSKLVSINYSTQYTVWQDTVAENYKVLSSVLNGYCDKEITDHVILTEDVRATTYDGSLTVYVNYSFEDYTAADGTLVPARGYATVKEAA